MNNNIASTLKRLRYASHVSVKQAASRLKQYDIDISPKTIYGYESGLSMPNADVFVALCQIYDTDHPSAPADNECLHTKNMPFSQEELSFLYDFKALDSFGQDIVRQILEHEKERIRQTSKTANANIIPPV